MKNTIWICGSEPGGTVVSILNGNNVHAETRSWIEVADAPACGSRADANLRHAVVSRPRDRSVAAGNCHHRYGGVIKGASYGGSRKQSNQMTVWGDSHRNLFNSFGLHQMQSLVKV